MPPTLHVLFCEQDPARPITSATSELGIAAPWQESNSSVTEFTDCVCFILLPASKNPRRFKLRAAHGYIGTSQRWGIFWIPETVSVSMSWTKSRCVDNKPKFWFLSLSFQISAKSKSFKFTKFYKLKMDPEWFDLGRSPSARRRSWPLGLRTACARSGWPFEDTLKPSSATTSEHGWSIRLLVIWCWKKMEKVQGVVFGSQTFAHSDFRQSVLKETKVGELLLHAKRTNDAH